MVLDEIARRVKERGEPFDIDGLEAIGGKPDEVLMITPEDWQHQESDEMWKPCATVN